MCTHGQDGGVRPGKMCDLTQSQAVAVYVNVVYVLVLPLNVNMYP